MISLDDKEMVKSLDQEGMLSCVSDFPEMLKDALSICESASFKKIKKPELIVTVGMGGSAIGGEIAQEFCTPLINVPFLVVRDYSLPQAVKAKSLVFVVSYSGNTEESLAALKEAENRKAQVVCITSGGKLKEQAQKAKHSIIEIKPGLQPRAALPYLLVPILKVLEKAGLVDLKGELKDCYPFLKKLAEDYKTAEERNNPAKQLARRALDKHVLVFCSNGSTRSLGDRFKCQLNENSKAMAQTLVFPELNHNALVALSNLKRTGHNYLAVLLKDDDDNVRVRKRMDITKSLVGAELGGFWEIESKGRSRLQRMLSLVLLCDFASVYLAILRGIDPTPVEVITRLKKELLR
jgi:glucose/mannose-6-phosphate isomerase